MTPDEIVPPRLQRLCDDASIFAPTHLGLADAVEAHLARARTDHRRILGPLLVTPEHLDDLDDLVRDSPARSLWLAVTVPEPDVVGPAVHRVAAIPAVRFAGVEVALPTDHAPAEIVPRLERSLTLTDVDDFEIYLEVPDDERRTAVLDVLADSDFDARFLLAPDLRPSPHTPETMADLIFDAVSRHLPFKTSGGPDRAVTGPGGVGFLNILLATDAARQAVDLDTENVVRDHLAWVLALCDAAEVTHRVQELPPARALAARSSFTSLGTSDPDRVITQLRDVGLVHIQD